MRGLVTPRFMFFKRLLLFYMMFVQCRLSGVKGMPGVGPKFDDGVQEFYIAVVSGWQRINPWLFKFGQVFRVYFEFCCYLFTAGLNFVRNIFRVCIGCVSCVSCVNGICDGLVLSVVKLWLRFFHGLFSVWFGLFHVSVWVTWMSVNLFGIGLTSSWCHSFLWSRLWNIYAA